MKLKSTLFHHLDEIIQIENDSVNIEFITSSNLE
jgi:hypothetical protein